MIKRALISVSDKTGIVEFAKGLHEQGIEILSTGGTYKKISEGGIPVLKVSDETGFPECLDGRVKTLHPMIHGGLLARRDDQGHMEQLKELGIQPIDLVVINLYPFKATISKENVLFEEAIENIDIGGPTMLRSAAKNFKDVGVVIDPSDYSQVLKSIQSKGSLSYDLKYTLALKVFEHTSHYDAMIADYLRKENSVEDYPELLTVTYEKVQDLRYGENPHQKAAYYKEVLPSSGDLVNAEQLHGKALSFNNINDTNGALDLLKEFDEPTVVAVKHTNACGVGTAETIDQAYDKAYAADPVSIFGGIIAANRSVNAKMAEAIHKIFVEIVIAPEFDQEALTILKQKKNVRLLKLKDLSKSRATTDFDMKKVSGGLLVQTGDFELNNTFDVVTNRQPTEEEIKSLTFAWKVCKHIKSNGIVLAKGDQTVSIGPGQANRIWATENCVKQATQSTDGAVLASDAFFPFSDNVEAAAKAGVTAIIQPGGSIKDQDSIDMANKHNIAMIFTNMRHFKH